MAVICIRNITGIPDKLSRRVYFYFFFGGGGGGGWGDERGQGRLETLPAFYLRTSACYQKPCHNMPSGWKCVTYFYVSFIFPYLQLHINPDTVE